MGAFFTYLSNITYYLLFAAVINMVTPSGKYKKLVFMVMGFTLIVLIIAPLRNLTPAFQINNFFYEMVNIPHTQAFAQDINDTQHHAILSAAFEEQLFMQLQAHLSRNGFTLTQAAFAYSNDFSRITEIRLTVEEESTRRTPFIRIEPVQLNRNPTETETHPQTQKIKNLVGDFYNLSPAHIHVTIPQKVW